MSLPRRSVILPEAILRGEVTYSAARVYGALARRWNRRERCARPSLATLMADTGIAHSKTLTAALSELEGVGLIRRDVTRGVGTRYFLPEEECTTTGVETPGLEAGTGVETPGLEAGTGVETPGLEAGTGVETPGLETPGVEAGTGVQARQLPAYRPDKHIKEHINTPQVASLPRRRSVAATKLLDVAPVAEEPSHVDRLRLAIIEAMGYTSSSFPVAMRRQLASKLKRRDVQAVPLDRVGVVAAEIFEWSRSRPRSVERFVDQLVVDRTPPRTKPKPPASARPLTSEDVARLTATLKGTP